MNTEQFSTPLLEWYDKNKREMIWRDHFDPYYIWLSEIMLQQTRIEAVKEYFVRFTEELPDIESLAGVSEERLLKLWEGLGYYNRARNLKKAAKIVVQDYGGKLPADFNKLISLPGIGPYTAGAIASMAFNIKAPAVDGNVLRVVMRYMKCDDDISKISVRKKVERHICSVMPERPGDFNQAIMELGEVICIPNGAPLCEKCPLEETCRARAAGCQEEYPKKAEKKPRRVEKRTIIVWEWESRLGIQKRPEKGLLAGAYEFPSLDGWVTEKGMKEKIEQLGMTGYKISPLGGATHIFSHVEWRMKGYHIILDGGLEEPGLPRDVVFVTREELDQKYMLPVAFHSYFKRITTFGQTSVKPARGIRE